MPAAIRRPAHRRRASASVVCAVFVALVAAPTAAYAATPDIALGFAAPSLTGRPGEVVSVQLQVTNLDVESASAPVTATLQIAGSSVLSIAAPLAACQPAGSSCDFTGGIGPGTTTTMSMTLRLGTSGSITATSSMAGDSNAGNDTATIAVTVLAPPAATVTLRGPLGAVDSGAVFALVATATAAGAPLARQPLTLLRKDAGRPSFASIGTLYTDARGVAGWRGRPTRSASYKIVYAAPPGSAAGSAESPVIAVKVRYAVTAASSPVAMPPGSVATLTIKVARGAVGTPVTVQKRFGNGRWVSIAHPTLAAGGLARVRLRALDAAGLYTFRAIRAGDAAGEQGLGEARINVVTTGKGSAASWTPLRGGKARPARWNPCEPITYFVNPRQMPASGLADLREALRRISLASGLTFRYGGRENAIPTRQYRVSRRGILVAWASPAQTQGLLPGEAVAAAASVVRGRQVRAGVVVVNTDYVPEPGFGAGSPLGLVLMHELGHVIGLDHVNDGWSLMHPTADLPAAVWGAGDLAGLRALGRPAGCF